MDNATKQHLARLRSATTHRTQRGDISRWVCEHTYLNGRKFSTKDHEFQERIMNDPSAEIVIIKSAQMGISEMAMRMSAALVMTMPDSFAIAYVFPTAAFSRQYSSTRFGPIVNSSPTLRAAMNSEDMDSAEVRTFGPGRQIYFKGASSGNSAISTSLDLVVADEVSFSDPQVLGDFTSRTIHSKWKMSIKLSTPTTPGDQIDTAFQASKRWRNFCKCNHCGNYFYPSFYEHVVIPGYNKHLDEINAENLHTVDYRNAAVMCLHCGKAPSLQPEYRHWICENPSENYTATGYKLSPFDAPNVITVPYLVEASTKYANKAKFRQFNLGEPSADAESGLTEEDLEKSGIDMAMGSSPLGTHVMGIDLGLVCHFVIVGMTGDQKVMVVHYERVPLSTFRERYAALKMQYRVTVVVSDLQPYTDLIMAMQGVDINLWGASFVVKNGLELFDVRKKEADFTEGQQDLREIQINRNAALDRLLMEFRQGNMAVAKGPDWQLFKEHLQDMKRVNAALRNGEFHAIWSKSSRKREHYHMALLYAFIATMMRGVSSGVSVFAGVAKFKHKPILTPEQKRLEALRIADPLSR